MLGKRGFSFQLGELHEKALGTAFQKEHSSLYRRFLFVLFFSCSYSDWAAGVQQLVDVAITSSDSDLFIFLEAVSADACCSGDIERSLETTGVLPLPLPVGHDSGFTGCDLRASALA